VLTVIEGTDATSFEAGTPSWEMVDAQAYTPPTRRRDQETGNIDLEGKNHDKHDRRVALILKFYSFRVGDP
jgi:hypothetical protein